MMSPMLCGDEVRAAVIDIGKASSRFGTAGEDSPKHIIRSDSGRTIGNENDLKKLWGQQLRVVRDNVVVDSIVDSGGGLQWDQVESLLQHGLGESMRISPSEFPLLISNSCYNNYLESSEKLMEICFEKLSSPATYIASGGMLSSFSTGRPTSLVIDFGARSTRIIPVIDGYVLNRAVIETSRGGDWMDRHTDKELQASGSTVKPWFETDGKNYPIPDRSFRDMHVRDTVRDIKHWMSLVTEKRVEDSMREEHFNGLSILAYELPDGTIVRPSASLCSAAEPLFQSTTAARKRPRPAPSAGIPSHVQPLDIDVDADSLQDLIHASVLRCDVDVRKDLLQNILLVGGGSLIDGIPARLTNELTEILPTNMKVKTVTPLPVERLHAAWIGGSILSICGSFQQLWITRPEYEEYGSVSLCLHRLMY